MDISKKMICTNSANYLTIDSPLLQVSLYSSLNKNYRWHYVHASNKTGHRLIDSWIYLVSLSTLTNNDWTKGSAYILRGVILSKSNISGYGQKPQGPYSQFIFFVMYKWAQLVWSLNKTRGQCYKTFYCGNLLPFHGNIIILYYKAILPW